jgi:HK97 family phage prohead protease
MTDTGTLRAAAAAARATAARGASQPMVTPLERPAQPELRFASQMRASKVNRDGIDWYLLEGYASAFERSYEMWDMFGPYDEIVSAGAADATLAASPEVVYRFNHAGTPMAGTRNGRLELWADDSGLGDRAYLNPKRDDVKLLVQAIEDDDVREQSFMFTITSGQWSPDYTEYRINSFDLDRGDVGPVTYGANPHTTVAARSGEFLRSIPNLSPLVAREAYTLLSQRADVLPGGLKIVTDERVAPDELVAVAPVPAPTPTEPNRQGRSVAMIRTQLLVEADEDQ